MVRGLTAGQAQAIKDIFSKLEQPINPAILTFYPIDPETGLQVTVYGVSLGEGEMVDSLDSLIGQITNAFNRNPRLFL